jgi:hypothetical protein
VYLRAGFWLRRRSKRFRAGKRRSLLELGFIHYARWVLIDDLPVPGGRIKLDPTYLYFESNFNGGFAEYIDAFSYRIARQMNEVFGSAHNYPGASPATQFKAFIRRHGYECEHFFSAYPARNASEIAAALDTVRLLTALRELEGDDDEFAAAWRKFMTEARL